MTTTTDKLAKAAEQHQVADLAERRGATSPTSVQSFLSAPIARRELSRMLVDDAMAERWLRIGLTLTRQTPDLLACTMESFAGALMQCAQTKLEPGPPLGFAWILPFKNSRTRKLEATFVIGYPGVIQLAMRSAQLASLVAREVCEEDEFDIDYGRAQQFHHKPPLKGERGEPYGYYCLAHFANGGTHFFYMTREQVIRHRDRFSKAAKFGPWVTDFDAMARKTTILLSKRFLPASPDFIQASVADEQVSVWRPGMDQAQVVDDVDEQVFPLAIAGGGGDAGAWQPPTGQEAEDVAKAAEAGIASEKGR